MGWNIHNIFHTGHELHVQCYYSMHDRADMLVIIIRNREDEKF